MGSGGAIFSVTSLKNSSCPETSAPGFKAIFGEPQRQEKESEKRRGIFLERGPGLKLSHGGQGQLQQLSQGGVVEVGVALVQESSSHGIGTSAWLPGPIEAA